MRAAHDLLDAQSIRSALARNDFSRLAAARALGVHKTTLFRKMKRLRISLPARDGRSRGRGTQ
jgi:transcriptional regulator with GAF, ATPase, and Fis domain